MRLVIEVSEAERDALKKLTVALNTTYSALFRTLLRLAIDGSVPRKKLLPALEARPVLKVTLKSQPRATRIADPAKAKAPSTKYPPATPEEQAGMIADMHARKAKTTVTLAEWRARTK